ncbi:MAG TPA: FAD-dependent oxidoreductase, partial [Clostridia bacterium]
KRFYKDMYKLFQHVMVESPVFSTPDEADRKASGKQLLKHPLSYAKFLSFMNLRTKTLLKRYFKDPEIFKFFDKLTSTYCYTTTEETPAVLAAVMFVDNHVGGSYYPAGSSVFLPGKLEKVIEENHGRMFMESEVDRILFDEGKPVGITLKNGEAHRAKNIIYSGTVWNLYGKLIASENTTDERIAWAKSFVPTYPSVVLYAYVDRQVIPEGTMPIEMLVGNPDRLDESEVTAYLPSIDDRTICGDDGHVVIAIGPSFEKWNPEDTEEYLQKKQKEILRLTGVLENRFPGFTRAVRFSELATPATIERYTNKNGGAVAGPKQMLGQHMFRRMHIRSEWESLYCCGESTIMGTGTPAVTVSGLSAANAVLRKLGLAEYVYRADMPNHVRILPKPYLPENLYADYPEKVRAVMLKAAECQYCEHPKCMEGTSLDIRGIMRRVTVGNFIGAKGRVEEYAASTGDTRSDLSGAQKKCVLSVSTGKPVEIQTVVDFLGIIR